MLLPVLFLIAAVSPQLTAYAGEQPAPPPLPGGAAPPPLPPPPGPWPKWRVRESQARSAWLPGHRAALMPSASSPSSSPAHPPTLQNISDLETLWEVPPSPTGVLFLAHGCNHAAADFWPPSQRCPHCTGLPQERLVRLAALARGYAVIAVSSLNRVTQCWHNTQADKSQDVQVGAGDGEGRLDFGEGVAPPNQ